jgi:hypothetical protein
MKNYWLFSILCIEGERSTALHIHGVYGFTLYFSVIGVLTPPLLLIGSLEIHDSRAKLPVYPPHHSTCVQYDFCDNYSVAEQKKTGKTKKSMT